MRHTSPRRAETRGTGPRTAMPVPLPNRRPKSGVPLRAVSCPDCGAGVDQPCTKADGEAKRPVHASRKRMATRAYMAARDAQEPPETGQPLRWRRDGWHAYATTRGRVAARVWEVRPGHWALEVKVDGKAVHEGQTTGASTAKAEVAEVVAS